jgi:hypothetical protein
MIMLLNPGKSKAKKARKRAKYSKSRGGWRCRITKKCYRSKRKGKGGSKKSKSIFAGPLSITGGITSSSPAAAAESYTKQSYPSMGYMGIAANPRRRRGRNGRRRSRNYSTWLPSYRNPSAIVSSATRGFQPSVLLRTVPVVGGFLSARLVSELLARQSFVPNFLRSGMGNIVLDLLSTGLVFAGSRIVVRGAAVPMLLGGSIYAATKAIYKYVLPALRFTPLRGLADYLTVGGAAGARPLMGYEEYTGVAGYEDNNAVGFIGDDDLEGYDDDSMDAFGEGATGDELDA